MKKLSGNCITGGISSVGRTRVENDFYATNPKSVQALLSVFKFAHTCSILEPCVGQGHILNEIAPMFNETMAVDIVDRGYPHTIKADFLDYEFSGKKFDAIVTNPPFKLAIEFIQKSLELVREDGGIVAMFLKLTFLESKSRKNFFSKTPLKNVYVFSERQQVMRNGNPYDENGKPWSSTIAFAWFIWEKGYQGEPVIKWL